MILKDLPQDARPREKMLGRGPTALSDAELLALLLRTGVQGTSVLALAQEILDRFGGVRGLLDAPAKSLLGIKGLGPAKRAELMAVLELTRRALSQQMQQQPIMDSPNTVKDFLRLQIGSRAYESFVLVYLDTKQRLIAFEELFRGTVSATQVYPREVAQRALHHGSSAVILAHNHPSGDVMPSQADIQLTARLREALALLDVRVLDHVIVSPSEVLSMAERGLM